MNQYYVYALLDPRTLETTFGEFIFPHCPFYIGKGKGRRCYNHLGQDKRVLENKLKALKIKKIRSVGLEPIVFIIKRELFEDVAFSLEENLINLIGRITLKTGPLTNINDGGFAPPKPLVGRKLSEKTKEKIRLTKIGELNPSYGKPAWNRGVPNSEATRKKLSQALKGNTPWNKGIEVNVIKGINHHSYKPGKIKLINKLTKEELVFNDRLEVYKFFDNKFLEVI